jgi:formylmethanofuran dehydrogenase subunit C
MTKFMLLYRGDATPPENMTEEQGAEVTRQWGAWIEKHGSGLVDIGTPFMGGRAAVGGDGKDQAAANLNGYTIVEADTLEAAKGFCDGHPFLHGVGADFAIDVYELTPIEM